MSGNLSIARLQAQALGIPVCLCVAMLTRPDLTG